MSRASFFGRRSGETATEPREYHYRVQDWAALLKPRVMSLVVFTGVVGMVLAPGSIDLATAVAAILCIAIGAGASGAINMWYDRDIDLTMDRTRNRPIPAGRMEPTRALAFGVVLAVGSVVMMAVLVNLMAAGLLALTIVYYVFIYTIWLKRRTPQNIVVGGASGALPPVIGWAATNGDVGLGAALLFLIIFLWTPPHSWALALFRRTDYANAGVPMMPVAAGEAETRRQMLLYTGVLIPVTLVPVVIGMSGLLYGVVAAVLGAGFWVRAWHLWRQGDADGAEGRAKSLFLFSILYLFLIFVALLVDRLVFVTLV